MKTREEWHEYWKRYYAENIEYFRWYRKTHRRQINASRRLRYQNDAEYRQREQERARENMRRRKEQK